MLGFLVNLQPIIKCNYIKSCYTVSLKGGGLNTAVENKRIIYIKECNLRVRK